MRFFLHEASIHFSFEQDFADFLIYRDKTPQGTSLLLYCSFSMVSGFRFSVYLQECLLGDATIRIGYLVEEVSVRLTVLDIWTVHNTVFCCFIRLLVDYYCITYIGPSIKRSVLT